jgi:non-heme chloroperoxidase
MSYTAPEHVTLPSGLRLAYAQQGRGEPVLCLSGYSDSSYSYAQVMAQQPEGLRLLALTHRGHGDSARPDTGYRMEALAADALAFLDALQVPRACVVGHSMGSFVAQALALAAPERVSRLVLVGSAPSPDGPVTREVAAAVQRLEDPVDRGFVQAFQESTVHRPLAPHVLQTVVEESLKLPARVWRAAIAGMLCFDASERLHTLRMPVLILWGEHDAVFDRAAQEALRERIPGAQLGVYADTGHTPHWERPAAFTRDLVSFVRGEPWRGQPPGAS